jgi:hypothetical protein
VRIIHVAEPGEVGVVGDDAGVRDLPPVRGEDAEVQRVLGRGADRLAGATHRPVGIGAEPLVDDVEVHVGQVGADREVVGHGGILACAARS